MNSYIMTTALIVDRTNMNSMYTSTNMNIIHMALPSCARDGHIS